MTTDKREAFEKWASEPRECGKNWLESYDIEKHEDGLRYKCPLTSAAYEGYQAALSSEQVKALVEAARTASTALSAIEPAIRQLKAHRGKDLRLATPCNYAAAISEKASYELRKALTPFGDDNGR